MEFKGLHKFLITNLAQTNYQKELNLPEDLDSAIKQTNSLFKSSYNSVAPLYHHYKLGGLCTTVKRLYDEEKCKNTIKCNFKTWAYINMAMSVTRFRQHTTLYKLMFEYPRLLNLTITFQCFIEMMDEITLAIEEDISFWKDNQSIIQPCGMC